MFYTTFTCLRCKNSVGAPKGISFYFSKPFPHRLVPASTSARDFALSSFLSSENFYFRQRRQNTGTGEEETFSHSESVRSIRLENFGLIFPGIQYSRVSYLVSL